MNTTLSSYTQEVTLPSKGYLNPEIPEGKIIQRCMMVADQKFIAGSNLSGSMVTRTLLERTIESPETVNVGNLTTADTLYLLFKLRSLSYGDKYRFRTRCPECGKKFEVELDLSTVAVNTLDEDYERSLEVVLPHAKDKVYTKFLTNNDLQSINDEMERRRRKFKDLKDDTDFVLRLATMIRRIELAVPTAAGDKVLDHPIDIQNYIEKLTDLDATAIASTTDNVSFGIYPLIEEKCPHCREYVDIRIDLGPGFFRPKYDV